MLNYKIERLLFALLWITLICFFSFAIPPQTVTLLVQYQYTMSSLILTALILYLYTKIRNKRVLNVINRYLTMNEFEKCNLYLEKCIRRQPKVFWLKFQKLMMIALKGEITQFKSYSDIIEKDKKARKNLATIEKFELLFEFLVDGEAKKKDNCSLKNSYLDKTLYLICNQSSLQYSEIISIAFDIYNSPYLLYKSISAMLLANAYYKLNDLNNANLFNLKAKEFAPSNETLFCIEKILNRQF